MATIVTVQPSILEDLLKKFQEYRQMFNVICDVNQSYERDIPDLLKEMENLRLKWQAAHNECLGLKAIVEQYQADGGRRRQDEKILTAELREARSQIAALNAKNHDLIIEKQQLEEVCDLVRDLLKDSDPVLPVGTKQRLEAIEERRAASRLKHRDSSIASNLDELNIDYDLSSDNILDFQGGQAPRSTGGAGTLDASVLRNGSKWARGEGPSSTRKRSRARSGPRAHAPPAPTIQEEEVEPPEADGHVRKKSKGETIQTVVAAKPGETVTIATTLTVNARGTATGASTEIRRSSLLNRSYSEGQLAEPVRPTLQKVHEAPDGSPLKTRALRPFVSTTVLNAKEHTWVTKQSLLNPEHCELCVQHKKSKTGRVDFGRKCYKCADCQVTVCSDCRSEFMIPCVPKNVTPRKHERGRLGDYVATFCRPMIPHVVIHCVHEIERRGMNNIVGIYRVSGSEAEVRKLLDQFLWGKATPNLRQVEDTHVITGCLKKFLMELREPVIPHSAWYDFKRAAETADDKDRTSQLLRVIAELPPPNRDTLAYLVLHLQKVIESASTNKMPIDSVAIVFGPSVIGNSCEYIKPETAWQEADVAKNVMKCLLNMPGDYWQQYITVPDSAAAHHGQTPGRAFTLPKTPEPSTVYKHLRFNAAVAPPQDRLYPDLPPPSPRGVAQNSYLGTWVGANGAKTATLGAAAAAGTPKGTGKLTGKKAFFQPPWKA